MPKLNLIEQKIKELFDKASVSSYDGDAMWDQITPHIPEEQPRRRGFFILALLLGLALLGLGAQQITKEKHGSALEEAATKIDQIVEMDPEKTSTNQIVEVEQNIEETAAALQDDHSEMTVLVTKSVEIATETKTIALSKKITEKEQVVSTLEVPNLTEVFTNEVDNRRKTKVNVAHIDKKTEEVDASVAQQISVDVNQAELELIPEINLLPYSIKLFDTTNQQEIAAVAMISEQSERIQYKKVYDESRVGVSLSGLLRDFTYRTDDADLQPILDQWKQIERALPAYQLSLEYDKRLGKQLWYSGGLQLRMAQTQTVYDTYYFVSDTRDTTTTVITREDQVETLTGQTSVTEVWQRHHSRYQTEFAVSAPLSVKYVSAGKGKWQLSGGLGLIPSLSLFRSGVTYDLLADTEVNLSEENLLQNKFTLYGGVQAGLGYHLTQDWVLMLNGHYQKSLTPNLASNGLYRLHEQAYGVTLGLQYLID